MSMSTDNLRVLINWHRGIISSLHSRQLLTALATVIALLIYYFTGMRVSQDVVYGFIAAMVSLILGSSAAQVAHAVATASIAHSAAATGSTQAPVTTTPPYTLAQQHPDTTGGAQSAQSQ
jgi:hypothetical protein